MRKLKVETNSQEEYGLKPQTNRDREKWGIEEERRANIEKKLNAYRVFGVIQRSSENQESSIDSSILLLKLLGGQATHRGMQRPRERA